MSQIHDTMTACAHLLEKYQHLAGVVSPKKSKDKKENRLPITNTELVEILAFYRQGKSRHAITQQIGRTHYEIDKIISAVFGKTALKKKVILPEDYTSIVISLRDQGFTYAQIGERLKISTSSAFRLGKDL